MMATIDGVIAAVKWGIGLFGFATAVVRSISWLVVDQRIYSDSIRSDEANAFKVIEIGKASSWAIGGTDYHKKFLPTYLVSKSLSFIVHTSIVPMGMSGRQFLTVTLLRWIWLPPLIPVQKDTRVTTCESLRVHRRALAEDSGISVTTEKVIPPSHVRHDTFIVRDRDEALETMLDLHAEQNGQRFLLCGGKGVGKTVIARRFAQKIGAELYANWDPTVPGDDLSTILELGDGDVPIVINMPECNTALDRINRSAVVHSRRARAEVHDKTSWCNTFDHLNLVGATVILDTNLTEKEMDALDVRHQGAMLRHGRITARIVITGEPADNTLCASSPSSNYSENESLDSTRDVLSHDIDWDTSSN